MLYCRKEKKSDGSKYNVLLFFLVSHLQESVLFFLIHKEELRLNIFEYVKIFSFYEFKNDVEVVGINFAE